MAKAWRRIGLWAALAAGPCAGAFAEDQPAALVQYRQNVMKALGNHMRALGALVGGEVSLREQARLHADAIGASGRVLVRLFPAGSGPDKVRTGALAAVFADAEGFRAAAARFEAEAGKLVEAARGSDHEALRARFAATGQACTACHESYRIKDW